MRLTVPGASSEKSIFCQSYSFRPQFKFQNDILELHVVLAKKKLHLFEKYMKKALKYWVFPNFEGINCKNVFFVRARIRP